MTGVQTCALPIYGPQMVNNNSGVGIGMDEETEEPAEGTSKKNSTLRRLLA